MKYCKICGEQFEPFHNAQTICNKDHFVACPICGCNMIWNSTRKPKGCSMKCSNELRKNTVMSKYKCSNIMQCSTLDTRRHFDRYDNLSYIQKMDSKYAEMWFNRGVDVYNPTHELSKPDCLTDYFNQIDIDKTNVYITSSSSLKYAPNQFLAEYGVNNSDAVKRNGVTLCLADRNAIYRAIRLETTRIKNFSCQLTNYGALASIRIDHGFSVLINKAIELYELDSIIAVVNDHCNIDEDMTELGFQFKFNRPGLVTWSNGKMYKRTDDISSMIQRGIKPIVGPIRKVYTKSTSTTQNS